MARAILLVMDSVGIGGAADAARFGDEGADTLGHVAAACAAMRDADHNATLHVVYRSYGDVRSTEDVLGLLARPSAGSAG